MYAQARRELASEEPLRTAGGFQAPELRAAPVGRTHDKEIADGEQAASIRRDLAQRVYGAQAALDRLMAEVGRNDKSSFCDLITRDEVRDAALEPMHTLAVVIGRVSGAIGQARGEALVKSLSALGAKGKAAKSSSSASAPGRSSKKASLAAVPDIHEYIAILDHEDDLSTGSRTRYQVMWKNAGPTGEQVTWTDARRFHADALRAEGALNVVAVYEANLSGLDLEAWAPDASCNLSDAVRQLRAIELQEERRTYLDLDMSTIPFNPHMWPVNLRTAMSHPNRLNMHEKLLWAETYAIYQLRAEWDQQPLISEALRDFFRMIRALAARRISLAQIDRLVSEVWRILSKLERILPETEFSVLVHTPGHFCAQLSWFGPSQNVWMFLFERCS